MSPSSLQGGRPERHFPDGFLWGVATAAYQIEGAVDRGRARYRRSGTPSAIRRARCDIGDTGDIACDAYHRMDEDLDLLSRARHPRLPVLDRLAADPADRLRPGERGRSRLLPAAGRRAARPRHRTGCHRSITGISPSRWKTPAAGRSATRPIDSLTTSRSSGGARRRHPRAGSPSTSPWSSPTMATGSATTRPAAPTTAAAAAATHHLLLGHGLAVAALRAETTGPQQIGITLNLTSRTACHARGEGRRRRDRG